MNFQKGIHTKTGKIVVLAQHNCAELILLAQSATNSSSAPSPSLCIAMSLTIHSHLSPLLLALFAFGLLARCFELGEMECLIPNRVSDRPLLSQHSLITMLLICFEHTVHSPISSRRQTLAFILPIFGLFDTISVILKRQVPVRVVFGFDHDSTSSVQICTSQ